ncbi:MAG: hypothetical protein WD187_00235 [Candidatus Woykebacteria bacterium]
MNVELVPIPEQTAFWSVGIATGVFLVLLYLPVQDESLKGIRKLFTFLTGALGFGIAALWVLSNYVFVPGA